MPHEIALNAGELLVLPVPVRETTALGLVVELLAIVTFPVCVPVASGTKCTFTLRVEPAASVSGRALPWSRENEGPLTSIFEIVIGEEL